MAPSYEGIATDYAYIDAFQQWMVRSPEFFDVCVTPNMFGDIATDLGAVLQGGMGMAAGANIGEHHGMFEPIHGSAPKHAGKDEVNPFAMVLATAMMLRWLGERRSERKAVEAGDLMEGAVRSVLKEGKTLTYDLGGTAKCSEVGRMLVSRIGR